MVSALTNFVGSSVVSFTSYLDEQALFPLWEKKKTTESCALSPQTSCFS